ncbi:thioesterase family protein [Aquimarina spongiae]|uniref:Acyl-CoA thioester hydrolase n=1 Tax=Aquimarina spongiae TaxID=570521 RepID=A0A1M6AYE3_9FLAO|nr:thioesterase family protein [Aquimarina spongiae]SHI41490.1 hypothetical protein SAMN04488508_101540 [Aquimarina spongiae]
MIRKKYKVTGKDVDDFMIMHGGAYQAYIYAILDSFLFEKGYSKRKLDHLKVRLQKCKEEFTYQKHLMFTQDFFLNMEFLSTAEDLSKIYVRSRFFNSNNELCAVSNTELYWFDYHQKMAVAPPKDIFGRS